MADERNNYFKVKKVINFDIIHHQGRGDPLYKSEKEHYTIRLLKQYFVIKGMICGLREIL